MIGTPRVSVLLAVHNGQPFLREALESILTQRLSDLELLVIDDGSTDATPAVLSEVIDPRMRVVTNATNSGLAASLNKGLRLARGEYVARMDADDVALPERLTKQVTFLDERPGIGIVGSHCDLIDHDGVSFGEEVVPENDLSIRWAMTTSVPFVHPAVVLRRSVLEHHGLEYDVSFSAAQDFDLWFRLLRHTRGANLAERLVRYRRHKDSVGVAKARTQEAGVRRVLRQVVREQAPQHVVSDAELAGLRRLFYNRYRRHPEARGQVAALAHLYLDLFDAFARHHAGDPHLAALRRETLLRVTSVISAAPDERDVLAVAGRLLALDPRLPFLALPGALRRVWKRRSR